MRAVSFSLSLLILTALHIALAPADQAAAQAPDPLTLTITAERSECTAGTLNPVSWEITGGTAPYTLTVAGQSVDPTAESVNVTCGALPDGASEAPATISAVVTDAAGTTVTASAAYTIVPPLPAPTGLEHVSSPGSVTTWWSDVPGVAELTREDPEGAPYTINAYLVRYRAVGASEWIHALRGPTGDEVWEVFDAGIREFSVAALRHPLERLTPAALRWSAAHPYAPVVAPQNVVATATDDTVTVSWDKQPHGESGVVRLSGAGGSVSERFPMATSAGRHSITFGDLPPSTTYRVLVNYYPPERLGTYTWSEVTTLAPAPDHEPLPSGPRNLRATATHNSITVSWAAPRPVNPPSYAVMVLHAESGLPVDERDLPEGETSVTVIGTFWRIQPDTLYEVVVFELGIPSVTERVMIRTALSPAQSAPPLTMILTAERSECTAGTLNPVTWTITGGTAPYTLTVAGETVDADAESATVTCGALPDYGIWLPVTQAPGTIPATVTDATGAPATASAAYTIVPPLPAPTGLTRYGATTSELSLGWDDVEGAGSQSPPVQNAVGRDQFDSYLFRYRDLDAGATAPYEIVEPLKRSVILLHPSRLTALGAGSPTEWEGMVAAIRHPIEQQTPAALNWSPPIQFGTVTEPQNVVVQATHNTLDVSWDEQRYTQSVWAALVGAELHQSHCCSQVSTANGRHHTRFRNLTPDSDYEITISAGDGIDAQRAYRVVAARTVAAPEDWEPPPRGPTNLRATATHDSITVFWDPPFPDAEPGWAVMVFAPNGYRIAIGWPGDPPPSGWTTRGDFVGLEPETTYRVIVAHDGGDGASAEITITTNAAPPPLRLTLTAGRAECTTGTLNPVSWEISGGVGPYRLTVDGASVEAEAEGANATCGALPDYGIWLPVTQAPGTITATVTDASGATATASAAYTIVPPLPAPAGLEAHALRTHMLVRWGDVPVPASAPSATPDCPCPLYLLRWRVADTDAWTTRLQPVTRDSRPGDGYELLTDMTEGTTYELTVAALRDAIERETPAALTWSPTVTETTIAPATRVRAVATHDTITVTWDPQPAASYFSIGLRRVGGGVSQRFTPDGATPHQVVFRHLPPKEQYTVRLGVPAGYQSPVTEVTVSTTAPPAAWTPLPRGPQNLRTAVTHNSVTVNWDAPYAGANDVYTVSLFRAGEEVWFTIVSGNEGTSHVFTGMVPSTRYRVKVTHAGIVMDDAEVSVTTLATPTAAQSTGPVETCYAPMPIALPEILICQPAVARSLYR